MVLIDKKWAGEVLTDRKWPGSASAPRPDATCASAEITFSMLIGVGPRLRAAVGRQAAPLPIGYDRVFHFPSDPVSHSRQNGPQSGRNRWEVD